MDSIEASNLQPIAKQAAASEHFLGLARLIDIVIPVPVEIGYLSVRGQVFKILWAQLFRDPPGMQDEVIAAYLPAAKPARGNGHPLRITQDDKVCLGCGPFGPRRAKGVTPSPDTPL